MITTILLTAAVVSAFVNAAFLLQWVLSECKSLPLATVFQHCEAQGPSGLWPRPCPAVPVNLTEKPGAAAASLCRQGCPCHLALLAVYGPLLGITRGEAFETQLELAQHMDLQRMCGAAVSALTLLQAQEERKKASGAEEGRKSKSDPKRDFIRRFAAHWGSLYCKDIIGCDLRTAEGREKARKEHLYETVCTGVIQDAGSLMARVGDNGHWIQQIHRTMHKDVGFVPSEVQP